MVMAMTNVIKLKEPERCDYLYIDDKNRVHLLLPLVGGEEIGLDNTCQTVVELTTFFYGSNIHGNEKISAEQQLANYKQALEDDIKAINSQKAISPSAYQDLLREKKERLKQIDEYIKLVQVLKKDYDADQHIEKLNRDTKLPPVIGEIIAASTNAAAVRLSPARRDPLIAFTDPIFSLKRQERWNDPALTDGLGFRLRNTLLPDAESPIPIGRKSPQQIIMERVLSHFNQDDLMVKPDDPEGKQRQQKFKEVQDRIKEEYAKINPDLSPYTATDIRKAEMGIDYMENVLMIVDENSTVEEWIKAIIDTTVEHDYWNTVDLSDAGASVFYDGAKDINKNNVDRISIKVQFLLAETNVYCKLNKLSDANFGVFFDAEPHATEIAKRVKEGLIQGAPIEPIIYKYINENHAGLGLQSPISDTQQKEITEKFSRQYNTIKESPHFDEFLTVDADHKGNMFVHQSRISCHFLDFFARHTKGAYPLGDFEGYSEALQNGASNRLNHVNEVVVQGHETLDTFKKEVVRLLAENKPKELVAYLIAESPKGVPNYSMLSLETQNYIVYNRNGSAILSELASSGIRENIRVDLTRLLSRESVKYEQLSQITWSKFSSKPLLEVELGKIAAGLSRTADIYLEKREKQWFKGSKNDSREGQCAALKSVASEINALMDNPAVSKKEILETLLKSIATLDKIDQDISGERNLYQSTLQKEVRLFRAQLTDMCALDKFAHKSSKLDEIISFEMEDQFNKIQDGAVQQIVRDLPPHCHTNEAIEFFNTLNPEEATKVASYLSLEYREINSSTDKVKLLNEDIPKRFKEVNMQLLSQLKETTGINEEAYAKLSKLADKIPPELFTTKNVGKWSADVGNLEESNLGALLKSAREPEEPNTAQVARSYRDAVSEITGRRAETEPTRVLGGGTG